MTISNDIQGDVAWITICRTMAGNALRGVDVDLLDAQVRHSLNNTLVRVIVITGEGSKFFCTGGDLSELAQGLQDIGLHIRKWHELMELLESSEKPIIAAINGHAVGGGLEIALACHQRIAVSKCRMGVPELNAGLFPSAGGVRRLTRLLGASTALELVLSAELWTADIALSRGLINHICGQDDFTNTVDNMAHRFASFEPNTLRAVLVCAHKAALNVDSIELEISLLRECYQTQSNRTRLQNFLKNLKQTNNN